MWFDPLWELFESQLFDLPSESDGHFGLFNPYGVPDRRVDLPEAGLIRRANLRRCLESLNARPAILLLGEAPGWRGCRFSGVPFTDEIQLISGSLPFHGVRSSRLGKPMQEISAEIFWQTLRSYFPSFFTWNAVPFHPHPAEDPCANRPIRRDELHRFLPLLAQLIAALQPVTIVAIGRTAQSALSELCLTCNTVRHPAHGGMKAFQIGVDLVFASLTIPAFRI